MALTLADISSAKSLAQSFITFLHSSPSPYHAVKNLTHLASTINPSINHLSFPSEWKLQLGSTYTLNKGGFMITFHIGKDFKPNIGSFNVIASHTDSPCLKLTYNHSFSDKGLYMASVQCYGGGLWSTWIDRGLGFAGKVIVRSADSKDVVLKERLISVLKPVFYIPNLAIHLRKGDEIQNIPLDLEKHLKPIISSQLFKSTIDSDDCPPLLSFIAKELGVRHDEIIDFDLSLIDTHAPQLGGVYEEFVNSGRLDNLTSCYITLKGFVDTLNSKGENANTTECLDNSISVIVHYNYEEVGSHAGEGAFSCTTVDVLRRILLNLGYSEQAMLPIFARSFVTSVDMAHAVHPSFPERHQKEHQPELHKGVVIKRNPLLRYATELKSSCIMEQLASVAGVPIQFFRVPNSSSCGSTIGPFLSSQLGCDTADIGISQFAMHSVREFCGIIDLQHLLDFTKAILMHLPQLHSSYSSI